MVQSQIGAARKQNKSNLNNTEQVKFNG